MGQKKIVGEWDLLSKYMGTVQGSYGGEQKTQSQPWWQTLLGGAGVGLGLGLKGGM